MNLNRNKKNNEEEHMFKIKTKFGSISNLILYLYDFEIEIKLSSVEKPTILKFIISTNLLSHFSSLLYLTLDSCNLIEIASSFV